jgi:hypothetical protein
MQSGTVEIQAFDSAGEGICCQTYSSYDWYEGKHPWIDSDSERIRLGVRRIDGVQTDSNGEVQVKWTMEYGPNGAAIREQVQRAGGQLKVTEL